MIPLAAAVLHSGAEEPERVLEVECGEGDGALFLEVTPGDVPALVDGAPSASLEARRVSFETHPFFAGQLRIVLENAGKVDPERIDSTLAAGGYAALARALTQMKPAEVVTDVAKARTMASWWSDPGSACFSSPTSPAVHRSDNSPRCAGGT